MAMDEQAAAYEAARAATQTERDRDTTTEADASDLSNLAQSDSLRLYLREISRIPLLSAQDELSLAHRIRLGSRDARKQILVALTRKQIAIAQGLLAKFGQELVAARVGLDVEPRRVDRLGTGCDRRYVIARYF